MQPSSRTAVILLALGALLTVGLAVLVTFDTINARSIATREAQRSLAETASVIAAHARRTLGDISAVVATETFPVASPPGSAAVNSWLESARVRARSMPQVARVELIESDATRGAPLRPQQWLDRPQRDPATGQLLLPVVHRLGSATDAPLLVAYVDLGTFHAFYRSIENLSETTTALLLYDGTLLASDDVDIRRDAMRVPELTRWIETGANTSRTVELDGQIGAVVPIPELGLVVVSRRSLEQALEPWRDQALGVAVPAAVLTGLALLLLYLTRRQLLRLETDMLERRRLELEKEELRRSLQHAARIESLGMLSSGIAHDFSNVLSAVLGYGELARDHSAADSPVRRHAERIVLAAQRGKALVERLLAFVRAERGPTSATLIDPLVHETLDMLVASLKPRVRLERHCAAEGTTVKAAPTELHQILMNLATNAVHAISEEGVVTVSTRLETITEPRPVKSGQVGPGDFVRLEVSDTGQGIAPELIDRIFEPFFTTKPAGAGTGLGLSLVQQLAEELGGAIDVVSRTGSGSTFTVFLPCDTRSRAAESTAETVVRGTGETILLVDDEDTLVELGEELLAALGYEPVGFTSPIKAWEAFRRAPSRFDAVLTDETMPECTGLELARLIRTLRTEVPIFIVSGYFAPERQEQGKALGITRILRKPLAASELATVLAQALRTQSAAVGL